MSEFRNRPLSHATIARLLVEASGDPRLRVLFGLPPKRAASETPHGLRHSAITAVTRRRRTDAAPAHTGPTVVMFPIVPRPRPSRKGPGRRPKTR
jgi:hypothetical protein